MVRVNRKDTLLSDEVRSLLYNIYIYIYKRSVKKLKVTSTILV
jgi:hypothetical protein